MVTSFGCDELFTGFDQAVLSVVICFLLTEGTWSFFIVIGVLGVVIFYFLWRIFQIFLVFGKSCSFRLVDRLRFGVLVFSGSARLRIKWTCCERDLIVVGIVGNSRALIDNFLPIPFEPWWIQVPFLQAVFFYQIRLLQMWAPILLPDTSQFLHVGIGAHQINIYY